MREFFRGWRRKVGCVALVIAFLLLVTWLGSNFDTKALGFSWFGKEYFAHSGMGYFTLSRFELPGQPHFMAPPPIPETMCSINYLAVAVPLAVIAGALLLWPRRKRTA